MASSIAVKDDDAPCLIGQAHGPALQVRNLHLDFSQRKDGVGADQAAGKPAPPSFRDRGIDGRGAKDACVGQVRLTAGRGGGQWRAAGLADVVAPDEHAVERSLPLEANSPSRRRWAGCLPTANRR